MTPDPERAPAWLAPLLDGLQGVTADELSHHRLHPAPDARRAAVLILFGHGSQGPDVLLAERAGTLRAHPGQVAFPGGAADPTDAGPVATALREAEEETGLDAAGVDPLAVLPDLYLPPSGFVVTPVVGHWARPSTVRAVDPGETAAVVRAPLSVLANPANRLSVHHASGFVGPAFVVAGLLVWGFTAGLLSAVVERGGWARPWDPGRVLDLDDAWSTARADRQEVAGT